jgi:hypothetical protein
MDGQADSMDKKCMIHRLGKSPEKSPQDNSNRRTKAMKFMTTWVFPTGNIPEAAERFLAGEAEPLQV